MRRDPAGADVGESLIEVLIALFLVATTVAGILAAVTSASIFSDDHRKLTVSEIAVKSVAESVKAAAYVTNAGDDSYDAPLPIIPAGYSAEVGSVRCWPGGNSSSFAISTFVPCAGADAGLQLVAVTVRSDNGRVEETTHVMKRRGT